MFNVFKLYKCDQFFFALFLESLETMKICQRYLAKLTYGVNIQNLEHAVHSFTKRKMAYI
ncbi:hypothetical protein D3C72_974900 [compost metagenome]